jgi:hypothetical protein
MSTVLSSLLAVAALVSSSEISLPVKTTLKPYKNYTPVHPSVFLPEAPQSTREVSQNITNIQNVKVRQAAYSLPVFIGTPGQAFDVLIDTGSSVSPKQWLWVPSIACVTCPASQSKFKSSSSSTYTTEGKVKDIVYESGSCQGTLSYDTVLTGQNTTAVAQHQGFVLVTGENVALQSTDIDGVLGLAFASLSDGVSTFVQSLATQKQISSAMFSIFLSNIEDSNTTSNIIFGGYDLAEYAAGKSEADVKYIDVITTSWQVRLRKVQLGHSNIDTVVKYAVLDTGTSLLLAPTADYSYIVKKLKDEYTETIVNDNLAFECDSTSDMPGITFQLGSYDFELSAASIFYYESSLCYLLIDSSSVSHWVLGDVFLREYYVIYDMAHEQVGLVGSISKSSYDNNQSSDIPTWAIILIVSATFAVIVVAGGVGCVIYVKRTRQKRLSEILLVRPGEQANQLVLDVN